MGDRKLDRLFLRYRRKGDTAALGEVFDRAAPELLQLAMHLVRDSAEAEDVLQATFLAAIEGAESFDAQRRLMPWLAGILARQAGLTRRRARRVVEPDRLRERFEPDPGDLASEREFSEELVVALQGLPEKYREVIWLYLADGKRPVDIARDLGRAPGTVRMQMHRGLELLRRALPAGFAAAGIGAIGQTRGLAAIRASVLEAAASRTPPITPDGNWAGDLASSSAAKWGLSLLGAVLVAGGAWWWTGGRGGEAERPLARIDEQDQRGAAPAETGIEPEDQRTARTIPSPITAAPSAALPKRVVLRGRVTGILPGESGEVELSVRGIARFPWPRDLVVLGHPDAEGGFALDVTRLVEAAPAQRGLEELNLEADHPRYVRAEARIPIDAADPEPEYRSELALARAGVVQGRLTTPSREVAEGAYVALHALVGGAPLIPAVDRGPCQADGSFTLRAPSSGEHVLLATASKWRPRTERVDVHVSSSVSLGELALEEGASIEGTAYQMGVPMRAGALVSAGTTVEGTWHSQEGRRWLWTGSSFERGGGIVETDAAGHFFIGGLAPGTYRIGVARAAPEGAIASQGRTLLSSASRTVVEAPASSLAIDAVFATVHFEVRLAGELESAPRRARVEWRQGERAIDFALQGQSRCSISVEPRRACEVRVDCEGFVGQTLAFDAPGPGEEARETVLLQRDPALARLSLRLRAAETDGGELAQASFGFHAPGTTGKAAFLRHVTASGGLFELADLPLGEWSITVHPEGAYRQYREYWCDARLDVRLVAGAQSHDVGIQRGGRLRLTAHNSAGARLAALAVLRDARGAVLPVEFVGRGPRDSATSPKRLSTLGASDVHPVLPAGAYELELSAEGHATLRVPLRIAARETTELDLLLEPLGAGR